MHTVIRTYTCPPDVLAEGRPKLAGLEATMRTLPGFVSYYFLETPDGITTVTTTEDEAGVEESMIQAVAWVKENLTQTAALLGAPAVTRGEALIAATR